MYKKKNLLLKIIHRNLCSVILAQNPYGANITPQYPYAANTVSPYPQAQHPSAPSVAGQPPPTTPGMIDIKINSLLIRTFFFLSNRSFTITLSRCIYATILSNATWL